MPRVRLRPTLVDDLPHVIGEPLPCRIRAITALLDDRVIGVGGIAFPPRGPAIAFVQFAPSRSVRHDAHGGDDRTTAGIPEARRYPVSLHRAGLMAMAMIRTSEARQVVATADADSDVAVRWLKRLGFRPTDPQPIQGKLVFLWTRENEAAAASRFIRCEPLEIGADLSASSDRSGSAER
jgi:hypothetical protein